MPKAKTPEDFHPRRSQRIAAMSDKDEIAEPACSSRQLSAETVFSEMSTIQDSPESRKRKVSKVKDRIGRYVPGQWAHTKSTDNNLIPCLNACLDWLPAEGVDSLVHDVESCGDDEALYYVFKTLASGLLQPSEFGFVYFSYFLLSTYLSLMD